MGHCRPSILVAGPQREEAWVKTKALQATGRTDHAVGLGPKDQSQWAEQPGTLSTNVESDGERLAGSRRSENRILLLVAVDRAKVSGSQSTCVAAAGSRQS